LSRVLGSWVFEIANSATALFLAPLAPHQQDSKRDGDGKHRVTCEKYRVGVSHLVDSTTRVGQSRPRGCDDSHEIGD
jgi:hypothetical protein